MVFDGTTAWLIGTTSRGDEPETAGSIDANRGPQLS
jgi:hypothetical protein